MAAGADLGGRDRRPARIWAEWRPWSAAVLDLGTAAVLCCERVERKASMRGVCVVCVQRGVCVMRGVRCVRDRVLCVREI